MQILKERVRVIRSEIGVNAPDRHIHFRHFPCVGIAFLPVYGGRAPDSRVIPDKFFTLDEHSAAPATWIVNTAVGRRFQNRHNRFDNAGGRVKFAAFDALIRRELRDTVFIHASENIPALFRSAHIHIGEQIHDIAKNALVQIGIGVIFGKRVFQFPVVFFYSPHRVVNDRSDLRRMRRRRDLIPPGVLRDEENIFLLVCVRIVLKAVAVSQQFTVTPVKGAGYIAQENQPDDYFSVIRRRNMSP